MGEGRGEGRSQNIGPPNVPVLIAGTCRYVNSRCKKAFVCN